MGLFDITAEDIARGTLVKPGWYGFTVKNVEDLPAQKQKDPTQTVMVTHVSMTLDNALNDAGENVGPVPVKATFPSNAPGMAINFLNAFGENIGKAGKEHVEISNERHRGKKAKVYIKRGEYLGRSTNNCEDFMKL